MKRASWRQWGRTKHHLVEDGANETVCGKLVPQHARTTPYSSLHCVRCERKAPELVEAAEAARQNLLGRLNERRDAALAANRDGQFVVYRCRKCGRQHAGLHGEGIPMCFHSDDFHESDLETVEVTGPKWKSADAKAAA